MMEEKTPFDALALRTHGLQIAIVILVKQLEANGVLKPGVYAEALRATYNAPDAEFERQDYAVLAALARALDGTASG
jgi:hypothetical protein